MQIIKLNANNFKRLTAVEISPDENVVRICGANGQGKSSILDAMMAALGGKDLCPSDPIRHGETAADVRLDLGDLVVARRFTAGGTRLEVTNKDGAKFKSPQGILDELVGRLTFDPLAFARMSGKERRAALLDIASIDLDMDAHEAKIRAAYDNRRDAGRDVKHYEAAIKEMAAPAPDCPTEERSVSEASAALQAEHAKQRAVEEHISAVELARVDVENAAERVAELRKRLQQAEANHKCAVDRHNELTNTTLPEPMTAAAQHYLDTIDEHNQRVRAAREYRRKAAELEEVRKVHAGHDATLQALEEQKVKALDAADLPVAGLGLESDEVTFNGVPFDQLATSEQIKIGLAMAMKANPKLRVIHIRDGSLLDSNTMATITEMVEAEDYQLWVECVDENAETGVVIEDGQVKAQEVQG